MNNQLTPMQEAIDGLNKLIIEAEEQANKFEEIGMVTSKLCSLSMLQSYKISRNLLTELLQKEQQVHEEIWDDGNDNITYDEHYGYDRLLFFKDYYNTKFKENEK